MVAWVGTVSPAAGQATDRADSIAGNDRTAESAAPPGDGALDDLVVAYFRATEAETRAVIAKHIAALPGVTVRRVVDAIGRVRLWEPRAPGMERFTLETRRGHPMPVFVHVPDGYDPTRRYPLLLALHGLNGSGDQYIGFALDLLGDRVDEFIVAAPTKLEGCFITSTPVEAHDPADLLRALKRRYHLDSDRIYASGYSKGGHISFLMAVLHTDHLAAAMPLAATFATQGGYEFMDVMLVNLRDLPVMITYGALDLKDRRGPGRFHGIAGANEYMALQAKRLNVPIRFVALPEVGHGGVRPPADAFDAYLSKVRPHDRKAFEHWFRHQPQGRVAFVRQTKYQGRPWKGLQLRATPKGGESFSEAMIRRIKQKLAFIGGRIDGQTIDITTRKCAEIELLLSDELVDLDRNITVIYKGKTVYEGPAHRSISTMLDVARTDWEFQRLFPCRFAITRTGHVERR